MEENTNQEVSWNLSQQIINQIGYLLQKASSDYANGKIYPCFVSTTEVSLFLEPHLTNEEKNKLIGLENNFNRTIMQINEASQIKERDEFEYYTLKTKKTRLNIKKLISERIKILTTYRKLILNLLDKYGFSVSRKKDNTKIS